MGCIITTSGEQRDDTCAHLPVDGSDKFQNPRRVSLEAFQERGHPPERARVRFSKVLTRGPHGWQVLLYHRDIQPFTEDGRYPRTLTAVSPTP